jgi:hypothetical protein
MKQNSKLASVRRLAARQQGALVPGGPFGIVPPIFFPSAPFRGKNCAARMQKAPDLAIWNQTRGGRFCSEETKPGGISNTRARLGAGAAGMTRERGEAGGRVMPDDLIFGITLLASAIGGGIIGSLITSLLCH